MHHFRLTATTNTPANFFNYPAPASTQNQSTKYIKMCNIRSAKLFKLWLLHHPNHMHSTSHAFRHWLRKTAAGYVASVPLAVLMHLFEMWLY